MRLSTRPLSQAIPLAAPRNRLLPVMHLTTGDAVLLFADTEKRFEERAVFGQTALAAERSETVSPAHWMANQIEAIANDAHFRTIERPVIVEIPVVALVHPDTPMACDAAIARTKLCAQEICLEVQDAALAVSTSRDVLTAIKALRRIGFRVSLNATRSWSASLTHELRVLLDSLRVDARKIDLEEDLQRRIETAASAGMLVIAEHARWRDSYFLNALGIEYGVRMQADG
ncbi:MAG: hypothetical protein AAGA72_09470 [Pseudomonadota bacterium]